ncbi:MAG: polyhydroxyalkanoate synthesis regulator DNA-binding domain-containing protein [candidate division Zixibacteria bacterium]|nr:polyhydroxyalkanoate synthesis regulator DNA-binding domain-containing protein [candidate division Zixibacteria bacterium]
MRVIKRYSNRRLYDTDSSSTITQGDVAKLIRSGVEVRILESSTGDDITTAILGRIMLAEAESWEDTRESKKLLTHIIKLGGTKSMSILKNTVLASIGAFQVTKGRAEKIIDELIKKGELQESDRKEAVLEMLDKAEKSTSSISSRVSTEATKAQKEISKFTKEIRQYKLVKANDMEKLETKVDKLTKAVNRLEKKLAGKQTGQT